MGAETTAVQQGGPGAGKGSASEDTGLLSTLDSQIMRHQSAISLVTGVLAIVGAAAMFLGLARVSPLLRALSPF